MQDILKTIKPDFFAKLKFQVPLILLFVLLILLIPAFKYILSFLALIVTVLAIYITQPQERRLLLKWFFIALSVRLIYLAIVQFLPVNHHEFPFYFLDDKSYHTWSVQIAQRWHNGERPRLWTDREIGTLHTGYYRFVSGIYFIFGPIPAIPLLMNPSLGSILCLMIFRLAQLLLGQDSARKSLVLCALNPIFWFWSSVFLKDTLLVLFFVLTILLYLEFKRKKNILYLAAFLSTGYFLSLLRVPSLFVIILTIFIFEILYGSRRQLVLISTIIAGIILILLGRVFVIVQDVESQLIYSFLNALPDACATHLGAIKYFAKAIPQLFLAPFAWVIVDYFTPYYFLYPGQWFLYLFLLPYALMGLIRLVIEDRHLAIWIIMPIVLKCYLFLLGGLATRHVLEIMPFLTLSAAYGLEKPLSQRFMLIYFGGLVAFMLVQSASLILRT